VNEKEVLDGILQGIHIQLNMLEKAIKPIEVLYQKLRKETEKLADVSTLKWIDTIYSYGFMKGVEAQLQTLQDFIHAHPKTIFFDLDKYK